MTPFGFKLSIYDSGITAFESAEFLYKAHYSGRGLGQAA